MVGCIKRKLAILVAGGMLALATTACFGPAEVLPIEEIQPNETAFVVPLEGASKAGQARFMSLEYLEENKVQSKRVVIPVRKREIGRAPWDYEWIPTLKVIKVDRMPVTREWTRDKETGTSGRNEAIAVESLDSINFKVGVNITALVTEDDAAKFLYYFAGKPLHDVMDQNIRGFIQSMLSREFGQCELTKCRGQKKVIFDKTFAETREHFSGMGVTVTNMGLSEGLIYDNPAIQQSIDRVFQAERDVEVAVQEKLAQEERNKRNVAMATAERESAEEFAKAQTAAVARVQLQIDMKRAEAAYEFAKNVKGPLPNIIPQGSNFLFGLDTPTKP